MKRGLLMIAALAALASAGMAVADSIGTKAIKPAAATVGVTSIVQKKLRTCTGPDGVLSSATLDARGTAASSEPSLNGPARFMLTGVLDVAKNVGTVGGSLRIDVAAGRDTLARFTGVYANGKIHGLLAGSAKQPFQKLVGNMSADFNPATGQLANVKIGQTDAGGGAVLVQPGTCKGTPVVKQNVSVTGIVSALSHESLTVASVTCFFPRPITKPLLGIASRLQIGDRVQMSCALQNQQLVVTSLKR